MAQSPGHERQRERQGSHEVSWREPEAEHRGGEEGRDHELGGKRERADGRRALGLPQRGDDAREPLAAGAVQQPRAEQPHDEDRGPAQQPEVAVEEQRRQAVDPADIVERLAGLGRRLALEVGRVRRRAPVQALVDAHVEGGGEQGELDAADRKQRAAGAPQRPDRKSADHEAGWDELEPEPGQGADQRKAAEGGAARRPRLEARGEQCRPGQRGRRRDLRVDGASVRDQRGGDADREGRPERPGVRRHPQRKEICQGHAQRRQRRHQQLHALRSCGGEGGRHEQREAGAVWLVEAPVRCAAVPVELVGVEVAVVAVAVAIRDVEVAVVDQRLRGEQVVRLVAAVVRVPEDVKPEGRRVDGEQQDPQRGRPRHHRMAAI